MTFTSEEELRAWLGATAAVDVAPTLSPEQVQAAIDASRIVDGEGRAPVDAGYVATWNGYYAAALLLEQKAGQAVVTKTSRVQSFSSEGSSVTRTEGSSAADFRALAQQYRDLAFPSGPATVIDLGPALGPVPRSAFEGVTPDVDPWRARPDAL